MPSLPLCRVHMSTLSILSSQGLMDLEAHECAPLREGSLNVSFSLPL